MKKYTKQKVCIQGLGFVGSAMAIAVSNAKCDKKQYCFDVVGIDLKSSIGTKRINALNAGIFPFSNTDPKLDRYLKKALKNKNFRASSDNSEYKKAEIIVVDIHLDIPFQNNEPKLELDGFKKAIITVGNNIKEDCLVIIETTVPPGTCSKVVLPILRECFKKRGLDVEKIKLAHSYERVMPGEKYYDSIINFWRVYSGINEESALACEKFLSKVINTKKYPLTKLSSPLASETSKLLENTYRTVNIAFIAEWTRYAEKVGIDLFEVIQAIQRRPTHKNIRFPGIGIGGYCLTKDPAFTPAASRELLNQNLDFPFSKLAMHESSKMPLHAVFRMKELLGGNFLNKNILICGVSYRENIGDTRFSPSELIFKEIKKEGANIDCHDPLVSYWDELKIMVKNVLPKAESYDGIIFTVPHKQYKTLNLSKWISTNRNVVVLDGFMVWNKNKRDKFRCDGIKLECIGVGDGL
tara:strand:+ start:300 stop:1700 length:1401 start_codon:yes stop_codon:yes gene_type:complete